MSVPFNPAVRRLVRRELLGNKRRSFALFLLSFLPMLFGLMFAVSVANDSGLAPREHSLGQADAVVTFAPAPDTIGAASSPIDNLSLPGDPQIVAWDERTFLLGEVTVVETDVPIGEPMLEGYGAPGRRAIERRQVIGRAPTAPGEALVSVGFAKLVGVEADAEAADARALIGRTFEWIDDPLEIVGVVDADVAAFEEILLVAPGAVHGGITIALVDWPGRRPAIRNFELADARSVMFRDDVGTGGGDDVGPALSALMMVGLTVTTGAVATAAWSSSARRRLHDVGIFIASGGSTGHVSQIQAGQAALIAFAAAVASLATALLTFPRMPWITSTAGTRWPVASMLAVVIVGMLGATFAGWWPAHQSGRAPLAAMLAGRLPRPRTTKLGAGGGVLAVVFGLMALAATTGTDSDEAFVFFGVVGMVSMSLGVLPIASGFFQVLAAAGTRLPVAPRLVLRDAARNAGRSTAAVLAIGSVVAAVWAGSMDAEQYRTGNGSGRINAGDTQTDWLVVRDPSAARRDATASALSEDMAGQRAAGPIRLEAYAFAHAEAAARNGRVALPEVMWDESPVYVGSAEATPDELRMVSSVAYQLVPDAPEGFVRVPTDDLVMFRLADGVNGDAFAADPRIVRIRRVSDASGGNQTIWGSGEPPGDPDRTTQLVLLAVGLAISGVVVAAMTMLTASEAGPDLLVMGDVGASTAFRRRFLALQALLVTGFATAAGLVMAVLIRLTVDAEGGLPIPVDILLGLVAMPFVAAALVYLSMVFVRPPNADRFRLAA